MKITIAATPGRKVSGQNRVLLEYAFHLTLRGHEVNVLKPARNGPLLRLLPRKHWPFSLPWFNSNCPLQLIPSLQPAFVPEADVLIFSSVRFIPEIASLPTDKGRPVFLVQGAPYAENPPAGLTERFQLIAISSRNLETLNRKLPGRKIDLLVNGINLSRFCNPEKIFRPAQTVGMIFYQKKPPHKGLEDGLQAFKTARQKFPNLRLKMAGEKRENWLPPDVEFCDGINQDNLVAFYRSLDIFLYPSRLDACPLTPMEALACKCGLATTDVSGISDFTIPGKTCLVSPVNDALKLAENLIRLVENQELLKQMGIAGHEKIQEFSYENQAEKLERILQDDTNAG